MGQHGRITLFEPESDFKPEDAIAHSSGRKVDDTRSWRWHETWQGAHNRAFVVAKMMSADMLSDVHASLQQAVENGWSYDTWKKEVLPKLEGSWIGKTVGELWDELPEEERAGRKPPSADQREKIISPNRLQTIYRTNMAVAYQAGKYRQQKALARIAPFWQYCTVGYQSVREAHKALHGRVFRHDDPFWNTHYPPNGWGCRCYVRALDQDDLDEEGLTVTDSRGHMVTKEYEPNGETVVGYNFDGQTTYTAPGWSYNPGNDQQFIDTCERKAELYPEPIQEQFKADLDEARRRNQELLDQINGESNARQKAFEETQKPADAKAISDKQSPAAVIVGDTDADTNAVEELLAEAKATGTKARAAAKKATTTAKKPSAKRQRKQNLQALAALISELSSAISYTESELSNLQAQADAKKASLEQSGADTAAVQAFVSAFANQKAAVQADIAGATDFLARARALYDRLSSSANTAEFAEESTEDTQTGLRGWIRKLKGWKTALLDTLIRSLTGYYPLIEPESQEEREVLETFRATNKLHDPQKGTTPISFSGLKDVRKEFIEGMIRTNGIENCAVWDKNENLIGGGMGGEHDIDLLSVVVNIARTSNSITEEEKSLINDLHSRFSKLSSDELNKLMSLCKKTTDGCTVTHNHPGGGVISADDIVVSKFIGASRLRMVNRQYLMDSNIFPDDSNASELKTNVKAIWDKAYVDSIGTNGNIDPELFAKHPTLSKLLSCITTYYEV